MYPQAHRKQNLVLGGVDRFDRRQVAQKDIEICDQVVDLTLAQPCQQRILAGERQADDAVVHSFALRRQHELEISSLTLLALDQFLVLKNGRSPAETCLVRSHQLAHLRACSGLIDGKVRQNAPLHDVYSELSPIDLGGAPRQFIRKPEQQARHIHIEMEMGLLAAGRHAFGPRVDNEWLIGSDNYWPDNATPASTSLSDPANKSLRVAPG